MKKGQNAECIFRSILYHFRLYLKMRQVKRNTPSNSKSINEFADCLSAQCIKRASKINRQCMCDIKQTGRLALDTTRGQASACDRFKRNIRNIPTHCSFPQQKYWVRFFAFVKNLFRLRRVCVHRRRPAAPPKGFTIFQLTADVNSILFL